MKPMTLAVFLIAFSMVAYSLPVTAGGSLFIHIDSNQMKQWFKPKQLKFQEAVVRGDTSAAAKYVEPKYVDSPIRGFPPIYYAALTGNLGMVQLLVKNGASVKFHSQGYSLAYVAEAYGHEVTARALVSIGGGSQSDLTRGREVYVQNLKEKQKQQKVALAAGLAFVAAVVANSSDSSASTDPNGEAFRQKVVNQQQADNQNAVSNGEAPPHPEAGGY